MKVGEKTLVQCWSLTAKTLSLAMVRVAHPKHQLLAAETQWTSYRKGGCRFLTKSA